MSLSSLRKDIVARKAALGITEADIEAARNLGTRRTPEKRAALARIQTRARERGLSPLPANF
jgi:hypothetical protein